jgi:hypothetical protein
MTQPNGAASAAADDDVRPDEIEPEAEAPEPETVLIQHEGRTYQLPAALKGALMRQADYTRKTQELAHQRRLLDAGRQVLAEQAKRHGDHLMDHARLAGLDDQIGRLEQLNWPVLQRQNPAQAQQLLNQLFQMKQAREIAAGHLSHKQAVRAFEQQRQHARQVEHAQAVVARDIEGWSPERAGRLVQYALSHGITEDELQTLADPRLVTILHHACLGHEAQQQASAARRLAKAQAVRPAIEVGGSGSGPTDPNRMSTDDWMKHRRGQLRSKARNR